LLLSLTHYGSNWSCRQQLELGEVLGILTEGKLRKLKSSIVRVPMATQDRRLFVHNTLAGCFRKAEKLGRLALYAV